MTDELLIKFLLKESTEAESLQVVEWRLASDANEQYYAQFEKIWEAGKALSPKSEVDENVAWTRFKTKIVQEPVPAIIARPKPFSWIRVAAILVFTLGVWGIYSLFGPSGYTELKSNKLVLTQALPDGSELTLNKNTQISYARNFKNHRSIRFKTGDVFFDVAKNKSRPFIIEADNVSVEVVGTSFNVKHIKDVTEVNVESGIVKVSLGDSKIELHKGERVRIDTKTTRLIKESVTDRLYNYYKTRQFIAENTPLWRMAAILNEAYGSTIKLDPKVKDLLLNTTLEFDSIDKNLGIICDTFPDLKQIRNGQEILLSY